MTTTALLASIESHKRKFAPEGADALAVLLDQAAAAAFRRPSQLARLHEALLFILAYPPNPQLRDRAAELLAATAQRVAALNDSATLEDPEVSGMAGTGVTAVFTRDMARHLFSRFPGQVSIAWDAWETPQRLGLVLPALTPLLADDATVESDVPFRRWLEEAGGLAWLLEHAPAYDALELPLRWEIGDSPASRTRMRQPVPEVFYHTGPLIPRRAVSLDEIPALPPLPVQRLNPAAGLAIINLARETSAARYRELHAFTHGDARHVYESGAGRGVTFYFWGALPEHRLPLRSSHAVTIWKNGVPVGYFEALSVCERVEAGFNLYYTFREGETAWIYAQLLRLLHQMLGARYFSLHPYQIGHDNEEALRSGAFWFYRKLGYRSAHPATRDLTAHEEARIQADPNYRTPISTLRRLARHPMNYAFPGTDVSAWERFSTREIGLRAARIRREQFHSDTQEMRCAAAAASGIPPQELNDHWAALLAVIPDLADWTDARKRGLAAICRARYSGEETRFLRLTQRHARFRAALLELGCPSE